MPNVPKIHFKPSKAMPNVYFISDAHLGDGQRAPERELRLESFLESIEDGAELYLLGDIFDVWFEYRTVIPRFHFNILFALKKLSLRNVKVTFITGNHDYWVRDFFSETLGMAVYFEQTEQTIQNKRCFIAHGDGLTGGDWSYRVLKSLLHSRLNIALYRLLHPDIGIRLASWFSRWSRRNDSCKDYGDAYTAFARKKFDVGFELVILGHTHRPQIVREGTSTYINVGDWIRTFTYGKLEGGKLTLEQWHRRPSLL